MFFKISDECGTRHRNNHIARSKSLDTLGQGNESLIIIIGTVHGYLRFLVFVKPVKQYLTQDSCFIFFCAHIQLQCSHKPTVIAYY